MRLGCNCSVGPLQAKLKIISKADGMGRECGGHFHQRPRETQWSESERSKCWAGPAGLPAGSSVKGKLSKVLGPLTEA